MTKKEKLEEAKRLKAEIESRKVKEPKPMIDHDKIEKYQLIRRRQSINKSRRGYPPSIDRLNYKETRFRYRDFWK